MVQVHLGPPRSQPSERRSHARASHQQPQQWPGRCCIRPLVVAVARHLTRPAEAATKSYLDHLQAITAIATYRPTGSSGVGVRPMVLASSLARSRAGSTPTGRARSLNLAASWRHAMSDGLLLPAVVAVCVALTKRTPVVKPTVVRHFVVIAGSAIVAARVYAMILKGVLASTSTVATAPGSGPSISPRRVHPRSR